MRYLRARRSQLVVICRNGRSDAPDVAVPELDGYAQFALHADGKSMSTTMGAVRLFSQLLRDKTLGPRIVPIVADEARTFGMANLFRQIGIYSPAGQLYEPEDAASLLSYREARDGRFWRRASPRRERFPRGWRRQPPIACMACGCCHFIFFIRCWLSARRRSDLAAADQRSRGFLLGATSGRTTLGGEGCSTRTVPVTLRRRPFQLSRLRSGLCR